MHLFNLQEKRRYLERFRFQAELALEDGMRVAYGLCVIGDERLIVSKLFTSPIQCSPVTCTVPVAVDVSCGICD